MAAWTSQRAGNWSNDASNASSPWNGGGNPASGVPGNGDTVTINHAIAMDVSTTVGASPAAGGTAAITLGATAGVLTANAGLVLTCRGDVIKAANSAKVLLQAGAKFQFDATQAGTPSTAIYKMDTNAHNITGIILDCTAGTSVSHCVVTSVTTGGAANGRIGTGSFLRSGLVDAVYTDFSNLGDSSHSSFDFWVSGSGDVFSLQHCTLTSCGNITQTSSANAGATIRFSNVVMSSSTGTGVTLDFVTPTTGIMLMTMSSFDVQVHFYGATGATITNNYFGAGFDTTSGAWASFDGNLVRLPNAFNNGVVIAADATHNYFFSVSQVGGNHHFVTGLGYNLSMQIANCIFEYNGSDAAGTCILASNPSAAQTLTVKNNIAIPNAGSGGTGAGNLIGVGGGANVSLVFEHNTVRLGTNTGGLRYGETYAGYAGMIQSCRSNLSWDASANNEVCLALTVSSVVDVVTGANCDYNGKYNAATGTHNTVNGVANQSLPGYENLDITAAPGAHDVAGNPNFVDSTRNLANWGQKTQGADGTVAGALAVVAANPALIYDVTNANALWQWVRAGFAPRNSIYHNTAHDGTDIGAVAFAGATGNGFFGMM